MAVDMLEVSQRFNPSYAAVASEYYDESVHPTCRNFRDASRKFLEISLGDELLSGLTLEVGAGKSLLGELVGRAHLKVERLLLLDSSIEMLSCSRPFSAIADFIVGDARQLPFADHSISLIVAALGDPYNVEAFWFEIARCLRRGGRCFFTTPSHEWASSFRASSEIERDGAAYFELKDGKCLYLPSIVKSREEQEKMIHDAGLEVSKVSDLTIDMVLPPYSSKIRDCGSVVTGYAAMLK